MPKTKAESDKTKKESYSAGSAGKGSSLAVLLLVVLLVAAAGGFIWSFTKYKSAQKQVTHLSTQEGQLELAQQEIRGLVEKVSKHMILPEGDPVVATIQDAEALKQQQKFYQDAENEDKLLIYKDKAIIYSPGKDRIVNVGPVFIQQGDQLRNAADVIDEANAKTSVELRNGTENAGLARVQADALNKDVYNVVGIGDAANKAYTQTVIVNQASADVSALANELGAQVVDALPEGEAGSSADVIIILGQPQG